MSYKNKIFKSIKLFCLRLKLKILERKRIGIIEGYILSNPSQASKVDDIESKIDSTQFVEVDFKIKIVKGLLQEIEK
jgi:hypothetical protein